MNLRSCLAVLATVALCGSSCRQIVGIEGAEVDPALSSAGQGSTGGSSQALSAGQSSASGGVPSSAGVDGADLVAGATALAGAGGARDMSPDEQEAGAAGQGGAAEPAATLCEQYCQAVIANCTGAFAVYTSYSACLAVCAALPQGVPGTRSGNNVECRLRAAQVARDEVPHYCPIAGPGGNGVCGSNCESLCQLRDVVCAEYATSDNTACMASCAKLEDRGFYSTDLSVGQYEGAHVQCRLYHVSAAAADDAEQHCVHVDGALPCR